MILASPERIEVVRAAADAVAPTVLELTERIASVPSPTGAEETKSRLVERLYADEGLTTRRDKLGNVIATVPGLTLVDLWTSFDRRPGREHEQWLNVLVRRENDNERDP